MLVEGIFVLGQFMSVLQNGNTLTIYIPDSRLAVLARWSQYDVQVVQTLYSPTEPEVFLGAQ